jgi:hypothetical protein
MLVSSSSSQNAQDIFAKITKCFNSDVVFKDVYDVVNRFRHLCSDPNTRRNGILNYKQLTSVLDLYFSTDEPNSTASNTILVLAIGLASNESIVQLSAEMCEQCATKSSCTSVLTACIMLSIEFGIDVENRLKSLPTELLAEAVKNCANFYIAFSQRSFESITEGRMLVDGREVERTPVYIARNRYTNLCALVNLFIAPQDDKRIVIDFNYPEIVLLSELFRRNCTSQLQESLSRLLFSIFISSSIRDVCRLSREILPECSLGNSYAQTLTVCFSALMKLSEKSIGLKEVHDSIDLFMTFGSSEDVRENGILNYEQLTLILNSYFEAVKKEPTTSNIILVLSLGLLSNESIVQLFSEIISKCYLDDSDSYIQILTNCILASTEFRIDIHDMLQHVPAELIVAIMYNITDNQSLYYIPESTCVLDHLVDVLIKAREKISNPEDLLSQMLHTENSEKFISPLTFFNLMVYLANLQSDNDEEKLCLNVMASYVEGIMQESGRQEQMEISQSETYNCLRFAAMCCIVLCRFEYEDKVEANLSDSPILSALVTIKAAGLCGIKSSVIISEDKAIYLVRRVCDEFRNYDKTKLIFREIFTLLSKLLSSNDTIIESTKCVFELICKADPSTNALQTAIYDAILSGPLAIKYEPFNEIFFSTLSCNSCPSVGQFAPELEKTTALERAFGAKLDKTLSDIRNYIVMLRVAAITYRFLLAHNVRMQFTDEQLIIIPTIIGLCRLRLMDTGVLYAAIYSSSQFPVGTPQIFYAIFNVYICSNAFKEPFRPISNDVMSHAIRYFLFV